MDYKVIKKIGHLDWTVTNRGFVELEFVIKDVLL